MDEVRISRQALSPSEIAQLFPPILFLPGNLLWDSIEKKQSVEFRVLFSDFDARIFSQILRKEWKLLSRNFFMVG